ncbi:D-alanyl-D-alanine carboxypeptidase family protein [Bombilactobacillus thymidiniphilus]|uniref:Serine hydrolase n=1 Tax=Bombilactobacillus thymidiniphilus TaxID=2923363 RepID=A0ABY4PDX4_9LACO|nr:serine hydrolase [Bombilactobacillus thymidiniphilus]UQS83945.1 serine hydrolase [Bombilactobacillus thymidiniphilus]
MKHSEYLLAKGHLKQAKKELHKIPLKKAATIYQQIGELQETQQAFNQGDFKTAQHKITQLQRQKTPEILQQRSADIAQLLQQKNLAAFKDQPQASPIVNNPIFAQYIFAGILVDQDSGQILWQKTAQDALPVASMSKLLALYTVYNTITSKHLSLKTPITAPVILTNLKDKKDLTNAHLQVGQTYSLQSLLDASLVASANDAMMTIGEYLYGSQENFVQKMIAAAKQMGLQQCQLVNATGLPVSVDASVNNNPRVTVTENKISAHDMVIIVHHLINKYPEILSIAQKDTVNIAGHTLANTNELLPRQKYATKAYQVTGLKTGTGKQAGCCLVVTANLHKRKVILVLLNASTNDQRFIQARQLLDYCDQHLQVQAIDQLSPKTIIWVNHDSMTNFKAAYQVDVLHSKVQVKRQVQNRYYNMPMINY